MNLSRKLKVGILCFLLIVGALIVALPHLIDSEFVKTRLLEHIEKTLGRELSVQEASLSIFPSPSMELMQVLVRDLDSSQTLFKAKRLSIELQLFPLFFNEVIVNELVVETPQLNLRRNQNGEWNLSRPNHENQPTEGQFSRPPFIRNLSLLDGGMTLQDELSPQHTRELSLQHTTLTFTTHEQTRSTDLHVSGMIDDDARFSVAGRIDWRDLVPGLTEERPQESTGIRFTGQTKVRNLEIRRLEEWLGLGPVPPEIGGVLSMETHFDLSPGFAGYDVVLSSTGIQSKDLIIKAKGRVSGVFTEDPSLFVTFSSTAVSLVELSTRFPVSWLPTQVHETWIERSINGIVQVRTATIAGSVGKQAKLSVVGEFGITEGRSLLQPNQPPIQNISCVVILEPNQVMIQDLQANYQSSQLTSGRLSMDFSQEAPWVVATLVGDLAAQDVVAVLGDLEPSPSLAGFTKSWKDVRGVTSITLQIEGPLNKPKDLRVNSGELLVRHLGFRSSEWPIPLQDLTGRIVLSSGTILLEKVLGQVGNSRVEIEGIVTVENPPRFQNLTIKADISGKDMHTALPPEVWSHAQLGGTLRLVAGLDGQLTAPRFALRMGLTESALTIPDTLHKPIGIPSTVDIQGKLSSRRVLSIDRFRFVTPAGHIRGTGKFELQDPYGLEIRAIVDRLRFDRNPKGMMVAGGAVQEGTADLSLHVTGKGLDWTQWKMTGFVNFTNGIISLETIPYPVTDVSLRLGFNEKVAEVKHFEFALQDSAVDLSGFIRNWQQNPDIAFTINSSKFNFDMLKSLFSKKGDAGDASTVRNIRLDTNVVIQTGQYATVAFSNLRGSFKLQEGLLRIDDFGVNVKNGRISGNLTLPLASSLPVAAQASLDIQEVPADAVIRLAGAEKDRILGTLSLKSTLTGEGQDPKGVSRSLNGNVDLTLREGRFVNESVVARIVHLLSIPALLKGKIDLKQGVPFESATGTFRVTKGVVSSRNMLVHSEVAKFSGVGSYSLPADQLDFVVAVSPFGAYSDLLKSIPGFKQITAGERKGLTTSLFEVKGPFLTPTITYKPIDSLAAGLQGLGELAVDMINNTWDLPTGGVSSGGKSSSPRPPSE